MDEWWLGLLPLACCFLSLWLGLAVLAHPGRPAALDSRQSWEEQWEVGGKMDLGQAEKKFWKMRELVERLLLFLDLPSTLHLIQAGQIDKQILQESLSSKVWKKLIKQSTFRFRR